TTIATIADLARATSGPIMEIGPGGGAVTNELYRLGRPLTLVELDETRLDHLEDTFPRAEIRHADVLTTRFDRPVIVGNLPFHLTTPILRRLLRTGRWQQAILLTQWEVARKRAGVGGSTMMTAQWAPWFDFRLAGRVPADAFDPKPSVDGGIQIGPVIVGNLPFHLPTPILRRLLRTGRWQQAILLTQWEVARKRAGVGGSTMMTAQWAPWFDFRLAGRVPADAFDPKPSVDGGI